MRMILYNVLQPKEDITNICHTKLVLSPEKITMKVRESDCELLFERNEIVKKIFILMQ